MSKLGRNPLESVSVRRAKELRSEITAEITTEVATENHADVANLLKTDIPTDAKNGENPVAKNSSEHSEVLFDGILIDGILVGLSTALLVREKVLNVLRVR